MKFQTKKIVAQFQLGKQIIYDWVTSLQIFATFSITILVLMVILVTMNVISVTYTHLSDQLIEDHYRRLAVAIAERLSESVENYLRGLNTLAQQVEMESGEPSLQKNTLQRGLELIGDFTNCDGGVIILDAKGFVSVTIPFRPDIIGKDFSQQSYFKEISSLHIPTSSNIVQEPFTNKNMVVVAVPIINRNGDFVGGIAGRFYIEFQGLSRQIEGLSLARKAWIYAVDGDGRLIYHPFDHRSLGSDFSHQESVRHLRSGESIGTANVADGGSTRMIDGFAIVPITGWGLVVRGPLGEGVTPPNESLVPIVLGLFLVAVFVSTITYKIAVPIQNLVIQAGQVAEGNYEVQTKSSLIKEIFELGTAFNEMVTQIRKSRAAVRRYVTDVTRSQEEERKRIARELHDDTVQSLIAIGQRIDLVKGFLHDPTESQNRLSELRKMVTGTIANVRRFSRDLRPMALEDLGLVTAMQYLVHQLAQNQDIKVDFKVEGKHEGLPSDMEVAIYRILQESLNNIRKHAQATEVTVLVEFNKQEITLTVQDNGRGFEVPESITEFASQGSFGVMGLQERAQLFGGRITLKSQLYEGTTVQMVMPRQVSLSPFEIYDASYLRGSKS